MPSEKKSNPVITETQLRDEYLRLYRFGYRDSGLVAALSALLQKAQQAALPNWVDLINARLERSEGANEAALRLAEAVLAKDPKILTPFY